MRRICDERFPSSYEIQLVDVFENPEVAERERVIAVPTLVVEAPPPRQVLLGDLSDTQQLSAILQPDPSPEHT